MNNIIISAFADESSSTIEGQIDALKRNNLNGMEIRNIESKSVTELTISEAKEISDKLSDNGLKVLSIGSPIGKISINDEFEPHLDVFKHTLELAQTFNCKYIRLFSFFIPKDADHKPYLDEVLKRMNAFCEASKGTGITLCHENEKGIYGDTAAHCLELYKALPGIRAIFDPANFIQCGQNTLEAWDMLHTYIEYMHIKDALPDRRVVPCGEGEGHIPEIIPKYLAQGGQMFTIEPHLKTFAGLDKLENGEKSKVGSYTYNSSEEAFDSAVTFFRKYI